ncbi:LCP family protein [Ammonifex thiophilus]|uniref:LytR family transcriptional regulator n=1 Tax=Ammonifex thiophilus TaxID=444093 RepID=A0A3D8P8G9_9THEO|nr:LCP family protein [Ammonifex thiophilus]RDV84729.1 LytR family transcriptional regulator [Ammonifex thiophilus]
MTLLLLLVAAGAYGAWQYLLPKGLIPGMGENALAAEKIHLLVLGSDARKGETRARSDSIMYLCADPGKKRIIALSIPRDTLVNIPGHGRTRINEAMFYGGPELSCRVVSDLIGQPVDYYVVLNFEGFVKLIDALGGITIDVEKDMYHYDPQDGGIYSINLKKGKQHLDGRHALMYVRYRSDPLGDIARVERQQKFLRALVEEMTKPSNLLRLPILLPKIWDCFTTNLPFNQAVALAKLAADLHDVQVVTGTLPGYFGNDPYWHVDPREAREVVARLMEGEPIKQFILETPAGVEVRTSPRTVPTTVPSHTYSQESASKNKGTLTSPEKKGSPPAANSKETSAGKTTSIPPEKTSPAKTQPLEVKIEPTSPVSGQPSSGSSSESSPAGKEQTEVSQPPPSGKSAAGDKTAGGAQP